MASQPRVVGWRSSPGCRRRLERSAEGATADSSDSRHPQAAAVVDPGDPMGGRALYRPQLDHLVGEIHAVRSYHALEATGGVSVGSPWGRMPSELGGGGWKEQALQEFPSKALALTKQPSAVA